MFRSRVDGEWIYWVHTSKGDSMLHNSMVAQELSWVMMYPRDKEELDSKTISKMVKGTFLKVIKASNILLRFFFKYLAKEFLG